MADYWQERFQQLEDAQHNTSLKKSLEIQKQFDKATAAIESKINAWYQRLADNNGVSLVDARRLLSAKELKEFKWELEDYIAYGKQNAIDGKWMKQLENASAGYHISRLDQIKTQIQQEAEKAFGNYSETLDSHVRNLYENGFYKAAFEIQRRTGVGRSLEKINSDYINKIISKPWAIDGRNFSDRIWSDKKRLLGSLDRELTQMCITGDSPDKAIKNIAASMNTSKNNAGRLVMTESAYFSTLAQQDSFKELDVEEYEIVATLDSKTSSICQDMDGKHFPMSDFHSGITAPPFHCYCRSCTCPYFDDEFTEGEGRVARDEDGNNYYVPSDMTYREWKKAFVDGDKSGLQPVKEDDTMKLKDPIMNGLPDISKIKTNDDIKQFAEQLIDNLGIDRSNIRVEVKGITDWGHCVFGSDTDQSVIHYSDYVLRSDDGRSMTHRVKTAFHESFHLSAEGKQWDGLASDYTIKEPWRSLEETFTESSAHYLIERYGITDKIAPSYGKELVRNLPRLKQLEKYSACETIQDFGKLAFTDRQNGQGSLWIELSKKMKRVKLDDDYYTQYHSYIAENESDLFDMFLANMPGFDGYREQMKGDLKSAMTKDLSLLTDNEQTVYYGILSCVMQKVGVK